MKRALFVSLICFFCWSLLFSVSVSAGTGLEAVGRQAVETALARLGADPADENLACVTSAGFARHNGKYAGILLDTISEHAAISSGRGNLFPVHCRPDEPLWFAFVRRTGKAQLPMTWVTLEKGRVHASPALDIHVARHQSFAPFRAVMGKNTFSVVTLANGWAAGMPHDLLAGACFHDHFCCGVATGYFTARFIAEHLPLAPGEGYAYIGAPAWCQDDYLLHYLNLTPGKHGYYTMAYPWFRAWQTERKKFSHLGGIVIRFNEKTGEGRADLLGFDWRWAGFKRFLGEPGLDLDWKGQPWLHVAYNRYLFQDRLASKASVSVVQSRPLKSRADRDALVRMGANPLEVMLGKDRSW